MNISCEQCRSQFNIPDEKLSPTKSASFLCPKCKNRISVGPLKKKEQNGPDTLSPPNLRGESDAETEFDEYDASEKPFDFMKTIGLTGKSNFFENRPTDYQDAYIKNISAKKSINILDDF